MYMYASLLGNDEGLSSGNSQFGNRAGHSVVAHFQVVTVQVRAVTTGNCGSYHW